MPRMERRHGDAVEALRAAGAAVEYTRDVATLEEPEVHRHHVVDVDEVAPLLAVAIAVRADEELDLAFVQQLVIGVQSDGGHAALVRLVRLIDVELAQTDDWRARFRQA